MSDSANATVVLGFLAIISTPVLAGGYYIHQLQQKAVVESQDLTFRSSCKSYKEMTTWDRWSTSKGWRESWCNDYLDRM